MPDRPTGTVTFLFTDIEGSTTRWEHQRAAMQAALARHDAILRDAIESHGGHVFKTVGDAFYAVFTTAPDAVDAALRAQALLEREAWDAALGALRVRMGVHTGATEERDGDYFGQPLNRVARILSAGHGGQILLSAATHELVRDELPPAIELRDLGEHRLKDLVRPERIFQLIVPGFPADFPPLRTLESRPNNLPLQPTPLIGREREIEAVRQRLLHPGTRFLTLTGPGGTGKTRLGLQVAAEVLDDFPHGVWFVDLTTITDPALVPAAIAAALRVQEAGGLPVVESVKSYLRDKHVLLVLDNFEQLLPAASIVAEVLAAAPLLTVLVMSRVPLHLRSEREFPVPALQLPDRTALPPRELLSQYESVRLFIERAQDVRPDWTITDANAPAVAEICYRLDGLPLAIELAAARVKALTPDAILARLSSPLKLLTGGARDAHSRQQTLRATIDWSYHLLEREEQVVFWRLAVFVGGCTVEAAEAVCDHAGELRADVLDLLQSLVDKSLLRQPADEPGEPRFAMLETIHEYARERLVESGEALENQRQHAHFFLRLAEQAEPYLYGFQQLVWLSRLVNEYDNLRSALRWCLQHSESETGTRLVAALWRFWQFKGDWTEACRWACDILAHSRASSDSPARATVLYAVAVCDWIDANYASAGDRVADSAAIFRSIGDKRGLANALGIQAIVMAERGDRAARSVSEHAVALAREAGDTWALASALHCQGLVDDLQGEQAAAQAEFAESARLSREIGDRWRLLINLRFLSQIAQSQRNYAQAETLFEESLALARELGNRAEVAMALSAGGRIAEARGDDECASTRYTASLLGFRDLGREFEVATVLVSRANLSQRRGDYDQSAALLREALLILKHTRESFQLARCLAGTAGVAWTRGMAMRSARLLGAAKAVDDGIDTPLWPVLDRSTYEQTWAEVRAQLGEEVFAAAWAEGRAMPLEQAVAYALEMGDPAT